MVVEFENFTGLHFQVVLLEDIKRVPPGPVAAVNQLTALHVQVPADFQMRNQAGDKVS